MSGILDEKLTVLVLDLGILHFDLIVLLLDLLVLAANSHSRRNADNRNNRENTRHSGEYHTLSCSFLPLFTLI